tara:strand:+ start:1317 stop:1463 length:147 start_codon:yes stop_codon:yes gene_type:complete
MKEEYRESWMSKLSIEELKEVTQNINDEIERRTIQRIFHVKEGIDKND